MSIAEYLQALNKINLILPSTVQDKITQIELALIALENNSYPIHALPYLPLSDTEIINLSRLNWSKNRQYQKKLEARIGHLDHLLTDFRNIVWHNIGIYGILNEALLNQLIKMQVVLAPILEVAAGNGFLAARLAQRDLEITAVDNGEFKADTSATTSYYPVIQADAVSYLQSNLSKFATVILSWSPDENQLDLEILQEMRQRKCQPHFVVIGERQGKTNSSEFWATAHFKELSQMLKLNQYFADFDLYHDRVYLIE